MKDKLQAGEAFILDGQWEAAENFFESMNQEFPDNPDILNNLGIVKESTGRLREAQVCFRHAVQSNPKHSNAAMNLASLYARTARWRLASTAMEEAVAAGIATTDLYNQMAVNYLNCGNAAKAETALITSLALDDNQPVVEKTLQQVREVPPPANPDDRSHLYRASFAEVDITPPVSEGQPVLLQGMAGKPREANAAEQSLMMQLMVLEDPHHTRLLFVTADIFGFDERMVNDIRLAGEKWGIAPEGIILNASHTHYAPGTVSGLLPIMGHCYEDYAEQIKSLIIKNISKLYHTLEPCRLYCSAADAQIGINRRLAQDGRITFGPNPEGPYDRHTPFVVADLCDSDQTILLASHGCHPTGMGALAHITSDYPGYFREALVVGGFADGVMFFQGAAGDIKQAAWHDNAISFCASAMASRENGQRLASALVSALQNPVEPVSGPFFCTKETVSAILKAPMSIPDMERQASEDNSNSLIRQWAERYLPSVKEGDVNPDLPIELQWISLGERLRFISFQGEPATQLAQRIRALVRYPGGSFVLGYTNGLKAYIPTDEMIAEGGYEVDLSHCVYPQPAGLDSGIEGQITDVIKRFSNAAERTGQPNGYGRYHLKPNLGKAFFVLSAGRCGTMTLARILNTADNARVWHHPQPDLIRESLLAYRGQIDRRAVFWKVRQSIIQNTWAQGKIHGETDLLMTPFCDIIAEEIPQSKFILLVRDPRDFVRSGMRRNYYQGHAWDIGRLSPQQTDPMYPEWANFNQFEKICWLWNKTYDEITERLKRISCDQVITIRFEDMISNPSGLNDLFDFLMLDGFDPASINTVMSKQLNKQMSGAFPKIDEWPESYHRTVWKHCGELAKSFGYTYKKDKPITAKNETTTIWDFRKFEHQPYPDKLSPDIVIEANRTDLNIDKQTKIVSMGSCFARNIAHELIHRNFNYIVTEQPFNEFSAHWGQLFNTACMRQVFDYTFNTKWSPQTRWWGKGSSVQDPFRRHILYDKQSFEEDFRRHREASKLALANADIVVLTLGLIETWRDKRDQMTFYRVPSPKVYNSDIHEFHVQTVDECLNDLTSIHNVMATHNKKAKLIISVSPVPLFATFRTDTDVVSANTISKATLRVAAEYFCSQYENVFYFPSFEMATQLIEDPYEPDNRHVTRQAISTIMDAFIEMYAHNHVRITNH